MQTAIKMINLDNLIDQILKIKLLLNKKDIYKIGGVFLTSL
jgi:hypothetical protein